jgi:hypothetical protein
MSEPIEGEVVTQDASPQQQASEEKPAATRRRRTVTVPVETVGQMIVQQQAEREQPQTPAALVALAVQQNFDIEKLERLLNLQREWQREEARRAFLNAFSKFQSELPPICRSDKGDAGRAGKRKYASLGTINEAIRPYLYANGLSFRFAQRQSPEGISVTCIVSHREGHSEETTLTAGADATGGKNAIQSVGSTVTYLERYTLTAVLGLTTVEDDDDGEQTPAEVPPDVQPQPAPAEAPAAPLKQKPMVTADQTREMLSLLRELFSSGPKAQTWLLENFNTNSPAELTETEAMGVLSALNLLKHEMTKPAVPPPGGEPEQQPQPQPQQNSVGMVQQWQRDKIKELTLAAFGDKASEAQAEWLRSLGYVSAQSLTSLQAADRIADLEKLAMDAAPF